MAGTTVDVGAMESESTGVVSTFTTNPYPTIKPKFAFSDVVIFDTATMEKTFRRVMLTGGTSQPFSFINTRVYVIELRTKYKDGPAWKCQDTDDQIC
jgi:hypothetical protein